MKIKNLVAGKSIFNPVKGKKWLVQSNDKYIVDRRIVISYLMILFIISPFSIRIISYKYF